MQLDIVKYTIWLYKKFLLVACRWRRAPHVILGPPNISECTRARKLKLKKMQFDIHDLGIIKIFC